MANQDGDIVSILIQLGVVGQKDVAAAKDLIKETGNTAKEATASMNGGMPENLAGWEKYKKSLQEAGQSTEELEGGLHKLRGVAKMAGPEFAEFGHLLHAATNPAALATAALVGGMEAYFKWQERIAERNKEMISDLQRINDEQRQMIAAGPSVTDNWISVAKAMAEARAQMGGLAEEMKQFEVRAKVFDLAAVDAQRARIDGRERELTLIEEQLELLAQIGAITKEEADLREGQAEHAKKVDAINAEVAAKQTTLTQAKNNRDEELKRVGGEQAFSPEAIGERQRMLDATTEQIRRDEDAMKNKTVRLREQEEIIERQTTRAKKHPLEFNEAQAGIQAARENEKRIRDQADTAKNELPGLYQKQSSETSDLTATKGLAEKFQGMQQQIDVLNQQVIDAKAEAPKKVRDENQRFAMDQLGRVLKDSGLNTDDIISQGASAQDDLRKLFQQGYNPDQIKNEGENALREKSAGHQFDQTAINRLQEYNKDMQMRDRLKILLDSLGSNQAGMVQLIQAHSIGQDNLSQEIQKLKANYAAILRQMGQRPTN